MRMTFLLEDGATGHAAKNDFPIARWCMSAGLARYLKRLRHGFAEEILANLDKKR